ncbi:SDR family oxidoreductase [Sporolactobacillus pectinivorans]|uniref:SDR family oxidoreductase n=1 Tax=Sporolactobacillus pectinivorans TaxID=1591408 RepID=UPI000C26BBF1|nr:aldehyde reductase [Sporolactobacillus pectinivorans]
MKKHTLLVTGGTGYLASWIIKGLLEEGHDVRITVRNKNNSKKYQHLLKIESETAGRLSVFEADLLKEGSFDQAVSGCDIVFHTASPFFIAGIKNANDDLIKPAKEGTRNVLNAVNKSTSVERVVLTSSVAAIYGDNCEMRGKAAFSEADWNETSSASHQPYSFSKTVAEREAWEMCKKQKKWSLVTINPSFLLGPSLTTRKDSTSISTVVDFLSGKYKTGVPALTMGYIDVRDVAKAEIAAAFTEKAHGRYLISAGETSLSGISATLEKCFPGQYPLPKRIVPKALFWLIAPMVGYSRKVVSRNAGLPLKFDNRKSITDLGMTYRNLETTLIDQKEQLERDGLI